MIKATMAIMATMTTMTKGELPPAEMPLETRVINPLQWLL